MASHISIPRTPVPRPHSEQERFGERLERALRDAGFASRSPARFVKEFNLRFPEHAVTVHAARKWIKGEAIPTQEKVVALANWLGVGATWMRYGSESMTANDRPPDATPEDLRRLHDIQLLDDEHKKMVDDFIHLMLRTLPPRQ